MKAALYALATIMLAAAWLLPVARGTETFYVVNAILFVVAANGLPARRDVQ